MFCKRAGGNLVVLDVIFVFAQVCLEVSALANIAAITFIARNSVHHPKNFLVLDHILDIHQFVPQFASRNVRNMYIAGEQTSSQ